MNLDKLTYAGNLAIRPGGERRATRLRRRRHRRQRTERSCSRVRPRRRVHLAAESHVDRSIDGPARVHPDQHRRHLRLLRQRSRYWRGLPRERRRQFRFHHVSTDEVFGSLGADGHSPRDALRAQLALLGEEGGRRSPRPRLAPTYGLPTWSPTARTTTARTISRRS